jgi:hypothetical protein
MKIRILTLILVSFFCVLAVSGQTHSKLNPTGKWKFSAPYAPEGYSSGVIIVGVAEKKPTALMSFSGSQNILTGDSVKVINDSVSFSIFLEGQDIKVMLKVESDTNMSGKAVYSEGEVPLALSKVIDDSNK